MNINDIKTLNDFENSNLEVYEVTKNKWVEIMQNHMITWYNESDITDINKRLENDNLEASLFHKEQVSKALKQGITVHEEVLKDYEGLKEEIENKLLEESQKPRITQADINNLKIGDKFKLNDYKLTVYKFENENVVAKLYRSKTKAILIKNGDDGIITLGWN
jgi:hypothetical protein